VAKYLTKKQLAECYGVSTRTVERRVRQGLPCIPWGKRCKRYDPEAVEKWLHENGGTL
jgi:phage terminase Nu1 subunit (DNA packaging protein)